MKTSAISLLAAALLASGVARGAAFEGKLILERGEPPEPPHAISYRVKGDRNRIDVMRNGVKTFMSDTGKKETTVILEDERKYLILPALSPLPDGPLLEKTEETVKLFGFIAQKYLFVSDEGTTELWLVEGLGKYPGFGEGFERPPQHIPGVDVPESPPPRGWEYALAGTDLFPLRVVTRTDAGRVIFRLEVMEITPEVENDRLFVPTSNYKHVYDWPKREEV